MTATLSTTSTAAAAEFIATEIAWNGAASDKWIAAKLVADGHEVDAALVTSFAIEAGLLKPIPRMTGAYVVSRKVTARTFGEKFARWMDERTAA